MYPVLAVDVSPVQSGEVTINDEPVPAYPHTYLDKPEGALLIFRAIPAGFNAFSHWLIGGVSSTQNPLALAHDQDRTIIAVFAAGQGRIQGTVFEDRDANGIKDPGEPGVTGAGVALWKDGEAPMAAAATWEGGGYRFTVSQPGDYTVVFAAPPGTRFSLMDTGDDSVDSDAEPGTGAALVIGLNGDRPTAVVDAGVFVVDPDAWNEFKAGAAAAATSSSAGEASEDSGGGGCFVSACAR